MGHIFSAGFARDFADAENGEMRLRIEDIDHTRCRAEFYQAIEDDLAFMQIPYDGAVMVQSDRMAIYQSHLDQLKAKADLPCHLTRRELDNLLSAPHDTPQKPAPIITNTDQLIADDDLAERASQGQSPAWRLRMEAIRPLIKNLDYHEHGHKPQN